MPLIQKYTVLFIQKIFIFWQIAYQTGLGGDELTGLKLVRPEIINFGILASFKPAPVVIILVEVACWDARLVSEGDEG